MAYEITPDSGVYVRDLHKSFGPNLVLEGVDLTVEPGTVTALLGPNGAGKTTMVRILSTLTRADSGMVMVGGIDVTANPAGVRRIIGLTGQYAAVDGLLTGRENLIMVGRLNGLGRPAAATRADDLLERFDLTEAADRSVTTYSGGMKRRLDLAMSLVGEPAVVFLDEPTTGLDPRARQTTWNTVKALVENGTTVLLTTQYLEEADQLADQIVVIDGGRVVARGTGSALKKQVGTDRLQLSFTNGTLEPAGHALARYQPIVDPARALVTVGLENPDQLRDVLDRLHTAGITPEHVGVARPTLDDVFLTLTEKEAS